MCDGIKSHILVGVLFLQTRFSRFSKISHRQDYILVYVLGIL